MNKLFSKPIVTAHAIKQRIKEVGKQISIDYSGRDLVLIGVLKGAYMFLADLSREITVPVYMDFIMVSSYGMKSKSRGRVERLMDITENLEGRDVIIVEDIVDSGMTISYLKKELMTRKPNSLKVCTLLDKYGRRKKKVDIDYTCFTIEDKFVVGYGLDYQNRYRNLPYIAALEVFD